jgi:hypothetical protein
MIRKYRWRAAALAACLMAAAGLTAAAGVATASPARPAAVPACSSTVQYGGSFETWFASPDGNGWAGGAGYVIEFSNTGTVTCTIKGYPRVALTENGKQVGLKATTYGAAPATVTLTPNATAHVVLLVTDSGALCKPVPSNGLYVKAPGKIQAVDHGFSAFGACPGKSTMRVDRISGGTGIPFHTTS